MRVQIVETGEVLTESVWYQRHPTINFGQPLTDAILTEANYTWPDVVVLARIFVPTLEWLQAIAIRTAEIWESNSIQWMTTTFEWNGVTWPCATDTETYFQSWLMWDLEVDGPWPEWFGWQDTNWVEHYMTQEDFKIFARKHAEVLADLLSPIIQKREQMVEWIQSCENMSLLDPFSPMDWQP